MLDGQGLRLLVPRGQELARVDEVLGHAAVQEVALDPSHRLVVHPLVDGLGAIRLEVLLPEVLVVAVAARAETDVAEGEGARVGTAGWARS